jgi:hypothetical protein
MGVLGSSWGLFYVTEENHENLNEDNAPGTENPKPPEYEAEVLSAQTLLSLLPLSLLLFHS